MAYKLGTININNLGLSNISVSTGYLETALVTPYNNNVIPEPVIDVDAQAFITAVGTLTSTEETAINNLVVGLKGNGTWSKYKAIYPLVGGTAAEHKWNLKDPRDLDAAFRLTFFGTLTHSATGTVGDGSTGYADTHIVPSTHLSLNSVHLSFWNRTDGFDGAGEMGSWDGASATPGLFTTFQFGTSSPDYTILNSNGYPNRLAEADFRGWYCASRISSTEWKRYSNGNFLTITDNTDGLPVRSLLVFGMNANDSIQHSSREASFISIGDGLTESEMTDDKIVIDAYQSELGRLTIV
jgi:hypothetical protein